MTTQNSKVRLATTWFGGCAGCHMSFLDLGEGLIDVLGQADLVYSPIADIKKFPDNVDVTLIEGAVANSDHLKEARGDSPEEQDRHLLRRLCGDRQCTQHAKHPEDRRCSHGRLRRRPRQIPPQRRISRHHAGSPAKSGPCPPGDPRGYLPPGCPPSPERILAAVSALLKGEPVVLPEELRSFG